MIPKLLTQSWKRELGHMEMTGTSLERYGHTWSSTCRMLKVDLVWLLMILQWTLFLYYYLTFCGLTWYFHPETSGVVVVQGWSSGLCILVITTTCSPPGHPLPPYCQLWFQGHGVPPRLRLARDLVSVTTHRTLVVGTDVSSVGTDVSSSGGLDLTYDNWRQVDVRTDENCFFLW